MAFRINGYFVQYVDSSDGSKLNKTARSYKNDC